MESGFFLEPARRAQKRSNFFLTEKIVNLIKTKNITLELNKVKVHSNNKWSNLADKLAKKGCEALEAIQVELGESSRFLSVLFWKNWLVEIPPRAFIKTLNN
ncbi:957_t:CDS:1, partial [Gigaspora rosea]